MYTLTSAKAKLSFNDGLWIDVNLNTPTIVQVIQMYKIVHLKLENAFFPTPFFVDLEKLLERPDMDINLTIPQYLESLGDQHLPELSVVFPSYKSKFVKSGDAFQCSFKIKRTHPIINDEVDLTREDKTDLLVSKDGLTNEEIFQNCLFTVNGLLHKTDLTHKGVVIRDGAKMASLNNERNVSVISFKDIGGVRTIPIEERNIVDHVLFDVTQNYSEELVIKVDEGLLGKTVLFSFGGYLHALDDSYKVIGENLVKVDFKKISMPRRYFESRKLIDLSPLNLTMDEYAENAISVSEILSNDVIKKYLTLSNSFIIIIDSPCIYRTKHLLETTKFPGIYFHDNTKRMPMLLSSGKLGEYLEVQDVHRQQLRVRDFNEDVRYVFETINWKERYFIDDTLVHHEAPRYLNAHLLELGRYL